MKVGSTVLNAVKWKKILADLSAKAESEIDNVFFFTSVSSTNYWNQKWRADFKSNCSSMNTIGAWSTQNDAGFSVRKKRVWTEVDLIQEHLSDFRQWGYRSREVEHWNPSNISGFRLSKTKEWKRNEILISAITAETRLQTVIYHLPRRWHTVTFLFTDRVLGGKRRIGWSTVHAPLVSLFQKSCTLSSTNSVRSTLMFLFSWMNIAGGHMICKACT